MIWQSERTNRRPLLKLFTFEQMEVRAMLACDVGLSHFVISEFQASNQSTIADQDGDFSDWIEIQNVGAEKANLAGWHLTDSASDLVKWEFPEAVLSAGDYLLVFASGKQRVDTGELHTNFKLSADGEYLALVASDGRSVVSDFGDSFPPQLADHSYGCVEADSSPRYFATPTPAADNTGDAFLAVVDAPVFSTESGFYNAPITVALSTPTPNATIHYTLDASEPDQTSPIYDAPLSIDATTIVRAVAFSLDFLTHAGASRSYIFLDDVLAQDGQDLPETWGTFSHNFPLGSYGKGDAVPANYEMDPRVVNDPRYRDEIKNDLLAIPTLSLVFDPQDLWAEQGGIYSNTLQSGADWERPVSAELIDTDGSIEFRVDAGARISGAFSRRPSASAKHSIRLLFKSEYGPSKLRYPWFGATEASEFDTVVLRATYNFSWARGERNNSQHAADGTFVQDRWAAVAQNEMGGLAPNGSWVHLYLNGLYWGLYNPSERPDSTFLASYLGGTPDDYDVIKIGEVIDGDDTAWNELLSMIRQEPFDYEAVGKKLDISKFIDYMVINHFGGNEDWPHNNWYASRHRSDSSRWQFHSWDAELLFRDVGTNRIEIGNGVENGPGEIFNRLRTSKEFRVAFGDRLQQLFFQDGLLTPDANIQRLDVTSSEISRAIVGESARWGDALFNNIQPALTREDWLNRLDELRTEYFPQRTNVVLQQYEDVELYPSVSAPTFSQHGGVISPGAFLSVDAAEGQVYYTTDSMDPRQSGGEIGPTAKLYNQSLVLTRSATITARVFNGTDWSAAVSADFIFDEPLPLQFTEIMYHPLETSADTFEPEAFEFVEVMNVGPIEINTLGATIAGGLDFTFPSLLVEPGQRVVVVKNETAFRTRYGNSSIVAGSYEGQLSNGGETIHLRDARGELIMTLKYDDEHPWSQRADGHGASLELNGSTLMVEPITSPGNWQGSISLHGTPGNAMTGLAARAIDELFAALRVETGNNFFDLNDSGIVDREDVDFLIESALGTRRGDVDLDGDVDFSDFLVLSANFGNLAVSWTEGDFDSNNVVDFSDFLALSAAFGFNSESN